MKRVLLGLALGALTVGGAVASPWINFQGMGGIGSPRNGYYDGSVTLTGGTNLVPPSPLVGGTYAAGMMTFLFDFNNNNVNDGGAEGYFEGFCLTPNASLQDPQDTDFGIWNSATSTSPAPYGSAALDAAWDDAARLIQYQWSTINSADAAVGFQLALWDIVTTGFTFNAGTVSAGASTAYSNYMSWLAANQNLVGNMAIYIPKGYRTGDYRGQVIVGNLGGGNGGFTPTPEPFTMGLGIAAAAAFARRRIKAKKLA